MVSSKEPCRFSPTALHRTDPSLIPERGILPLQHNRDVDVPLSTLDRGLGVGGLTNTATAAVLNPRNAIIEVVLSFGDSAFN